jgi:hypothetical protein
MPIWRPERWCVVRRRHYGALQTDFGGNVQYGSLLSQTYLAFGGHGATVNLIKDFRQILPNNPCRSGGD